MLLFELALTRVLSVLFYYHTAFLAISLALLGLGAGGTWAEMAPRLLRGREGRVVASTAIALLLSPAFLLFYDLGPAELFDYGSPRLVLTLSLTIVITLAPFVGVGFVLARLFQEHPAQAGRLYAANLTGSGVGVLLVIPSLELLGGPGALFLASFLVALSASFLLQGSVYRRGAICALPIAITALQFFFSPVVIPVNVGEEARVVAREWNALSRVVAIQHESWDRGISQFRLRGVERAPQIDALIDINAFAPMVRYDGDLTRVAYLKDSVANLGYALLPAGSRVAILGPGGGKDVLGALLHAPQSVTGIEINPILVDDFVNDRFRDFTGNLYQQPNVNIIVGDGRAELARLDQRFDIIVANTVVTWAAHGGGAMTLSEQTLFTVEAFRVYLERLRPGGFLSFSLWDDGDHAIPLRLLATCAAAEGVEADSLLTRVAVVGNRWRQGRWFTTVLIGTRAFTESQNQALAAQVHALDFDAFYLPGSNRGGEPFRTFLTDMDRAIADSSFDLRPATDDRPYFFYTRRLWDAVRNGESSDWSENAALVSLGLSFALVSVLCLIGIAAPLIWSRWRGTPTNLRLNEAIFFAAIGVGFFFVEIPWIQQCIVFLEHPTRAFVVVLFVLLLFAGVGSLLVNRFVDGSTRRFGLVLVALLLTLILIELLARGLPSLSRLSVTAKVLVVAAGVAPLGLFMGMPFAAGLHVLAARGREGVAWAWGVSASCGVLASILAVVLAVPHGYGVVRILGFVCYLLAWLTRPRIDRPAVSGGEDV